MTGKPPLTRTDPITGQNLDIEIEEIEELLHTDAAALLAYWKSCRQAGGFVMVRDVPSKAIARLTKHLVVLEPIANGVDFKYRLVGSVLIERLGRDVTGMAVSEVFDSKPAQSLIEGGRKVLDTDSPVFQRLHVRGLFAEVRKPELVLLPMGSVGNAENWILVGVFYHAA